MVEDRLELGAVVERSRGLACPYPYTTLTQPAFFSPSVCRWAFCSVVLTLV